jgi:hypothetical protein
MEREEWQRIQREIRRVLMDVWDPIGVNDEPACADEYDTYIGAIFGLLTRQASEHVIAAHLEDIVNNRMGLTATKNAMLPTVRALRAIPLTVSK